MGPLPSEIHSVAFADRRQLCTPLQGGDQGTISSWWEGLVAASDSLEIRFMIEVVIGETRMRIHDPDSALFPSRASGWTMETGGNRFRVHPYLEPGWGNPMDRTESVGDSRVKYLM